MLITLDELEAEEAGHVAEDMFVQQMRRRRAAQDLSQSELATRVTKLGGSLYQQTIAKIEAGTRAIRLHEADLIAQALGTTVADMLSASIDDSASSAEEMPIDELISRVHAAQRRRDEARFELERAREREAEARAVAAAAAERATYAQLTLKRQMHRADSAEQELLSLWRISLERQSDLNRRLGPKWREKLDGRNRIKVGDLVKSQQPPTAKPTESAQGDASAAKGGPPDSEPGE